MAPAASSSSVSLLVVRLATLVLVSISANAAGEHNVCYVDVENGCDEPQCCSDARPCKNIYHALNVALNPNDVSNLELRVKPGTYNWSKADIESLMLNNTTNFTLKSELGNSLEGEVVFRCRNYTNASGEYNNLAIIGGSNITIDGITVEGCGPLSSGIFVDSAEDITIVNCTFRDNSGGGIWMINTDNVCVENCQFEGNIGTRPNIMNLSNSSVFNFRDHSSGGLGLLYNNISGVEASVINCMFFNNTASLHPSNMDDPLPPAYAPTGHGGALIIRLADSTDGANIEICDCNFTGNDAYYSGGAVYVALISKPSNNEAPSNNTVFIRGSWFENNEANHTGGGISIQIFDTEKNNKIVIEDCNFTSCSANEGGGAISVVLVDSQVSTTSSDPIRLIVDRTVFNGNQSPTGGSAVGLVSNARVDQLPLMASFQDCNFTDNLAGDMTASQGALLVFRFPVEFSGRNSFSGNEGGAMFVFQTKIDTRGSLVFRENWGRQGGAVVLEDQSWFNLFPGTDVMFDGNWAESVGGAVLVNNPTVAQDFDPIYNTNCFFQYNGDKTLTPDKWNATVSFINNTAEEAGAAIFASNITVCKYTSTTCSSDEINPTKIYDQSIFLTTPFKFEGNMVWRDSEMVSDVATLPAFLTVSDTPKSSSPGEKLAISLQALDQSGNSREALWSLVQGIDSNSESNVFSLPATNSPSDQPQTFKPGNVSQANCETRTMNGTQTGDTGSLTFLIIEEITGEVVYTSNKQINVMCCHPGYTYNDMGKTCVLAKSPHILRASEDNIHVYINPGYYAGFYNDSQLKVTYFALVLMPESFQNCQRDGSRSGCLYNYSRPNDQCKGNRRDFMCGSCPDNKSVDLTLRTCKKCNWNDALGLSIVCVLVVVGSVVVLLFNIGVPNDLKGFLFFAQVVGFVYRHGAAEDKIRWDFHLSRSLGSSLYLQICPFTELRALPTAAFGLLPALLSISTVAAYIMAARVIKPLGKKTVFRGIWLIILFVYKYIADTVAAVLRCVILLREDRYFTKLVFYYDGTVTCYSGEHLAYAIPAILLLVFVVLLGPALVILISFKRYKKTQAFTDVITDGVRLGSRWWGGFDLLRRIMFITVINLIPPDFSQLSLCLVAMVVLGVLCFSKPYTNHYINIIEAIILVDLLTISFIFLNAKEAARVPPPVFHILLLLPYIYAVVNITCKIAVPLWKKNSRIRARQLIQEVPDKLESLLKPTKGKSRPKGLLVKSCSMESTGEEVATVPLGEENEEVGEREEAHYSLYREELLDS